MRRLWIVLLCVVSLIPLQAQDEAWSVWVYDANLGQAVQLDNIGTVLNDVILPVPAPYLEYQLSRKIAISPDGTRIAYSVTGRNTDNQPLSAILAYDTVTDSILFTYEPPEQVLADSFSFSTTGWNRTGNIVAHAYATGDTLETQSWRIVVLNAIDGRILSELDDSSVFFSSQTETLAPFLMPVMQFYGEASIGFSLVPYQTLNFTAELDSYEWDIVTGRVVQTNRTPRITGDTLQTTGETIVPIVDDRVNYDADLVPYTNAVHIYRPSIGARLPFFATETYDIFNAQFVQNGEQVLVLAQDFLTFDMVRLMVNRIGISRIVPNINATEDTTIGTPTGFAYVINNETPFLIFVDTRDESFPQNPIWTAPTGSQFVPMWATTREQAEYEAWLQLAPPVFPSQIIITSSSTGIDPQSVTTATPFGSTNSLITVDSVAVINTTSGDRLNMRSSPGLNGEIIARVDSGARVVILNGPIAADGFTWWEIRLPTGQTGWVVERADGVQTLLPVG